MISMQSRTIADHSFRQHAAAASILPTTVDKISSDHRKNEEEMNNALQRLKDLHAQIERGGPEKAREKHRARGKMLVRE